MRALVVFVLSHGIEPLRMKPKGKRFSISDKIDRPDPEHPQGMTIEPVAEAVAPATGQILRELSAS